MGSGCVAPAQNRGCAADGGRAKRQYAFGELVFANHVGADPIGNEGRFDVMDDAGPLAVDRKFSSISYISSRGFGEQAGRQSVERGSGMAEKPAVSAHQVRRHPSCFGVGADAVGRRAEGLDARAVFEQGHIVDQLPASDEVFFQHTILLVSYNAIMGGC